MQKCTNCGRPIPSGAKFCGHCGKTTGFEPNCAQQPPFTQYNVVPHDANGKPLVGAGAKGAQTKPNCDLSVAGFVMALFSPYLCIVSFILCAVALGRKQLRRKLAIAGLIISLVEIVFVIVCLYLTYVRGIDLLQYIPWFNRQQ